MRWLFVEVLPEREATERFSSWYDCQHAATTAVIFNIGLIIIVIIITIMYIDMHTTWPKNGGPFQLSSLPVRLPGGSLHAAMVLLRVCGS